MLGSAEGVAPAADLFTVVDQQHRIYGRKAVPVRLTLDLSMERARIGEADGTGPRGVLSQAELQKKVDRVMQAKFSPAAVVVDSDLQIVQFRGETSPYLDPVPGEASLNLLRMVREELVVPLRRALEAARDQNASVRQTAFNFHLNGEPKDIGISVTPINGATANEHYFLIVFEEPAKAIEAVTEAPLALAPDSPQYANALEDQIQKLQEQLATTRQYMRNLTEDYEASSEELRASNEEVRSSNEELQSTYEELSTTKEELQSANEELTTVNDELQSRNQELDAVNNDLNNLLGAVSVSIVMVDNNARVRRFNLAAERLLGLNALDVGRSIARMQSAVDLPSLEPLVHKVIETLGTEEREVRDKDGRWYSVSIRPYRTRENRIEGAVIIYIDIDALKKSLAAAEEARDYAESMIETVHEPLLVLNADLRVLRATGPFYESFQVSSTETIGRFLYDLGNGQWNHPRLRELLGNALFRNQPFQHFELTHEFPHIGQRAVRLNGSRIPGQGAERTVLVSITDVTQQHQEAEIRYQHLFENASDGILVLDAEGGTVIDVNRSLLDMTGYGRHEFMGKALTETAPFRNAGAALQITNLPSGEVATLADSMHLVKRRGGELEVEIVASRYPVGGRESIQVSIRDITARKRAERALRESEERLRSFVETVQDYAFIQMDQTGRILGWNPAAQRIFGYTREEILGQPSAKLFTPEDVAAGAPEKEMEKARANEWAEGDRWQIRQDGRRFFGTGVLTAIHDDKGALLGFTRIMRDTTQSKLLEEQIRASLKEKEVVLSELHHRVKNNLQMIASLIGLQSHHVGDPRLVGFLEQLLNRVRSIGTIHEMLYSTRELSKVDFGTYLSKIAKNLLAFYEGKPHQIELIIEVSR